MSDLQAPGITWDKVQDVKACLERGEKLTIIMANCVCTEGVVVQVARAYGLKLVRHWPKWHNDPVLWTWPVEGGDYVELAPGQRPADFW